MAVKPGHAPLRSAGAVRGELVRIAVGKGRIQLNDLKQMFNAFLNLFGVGHIVNYQWLANDVADGHTRIEAGIRILKDHL